MFTVCQEPYLITPLEDSTFVVLVRRHKVCSLGERNKKHRRLTRREDSVFIGRVPEERTGPLGVEVCHRV